MIEPIQLSWSYYWPLVLVVAWGIFDISRHRKKSELQLRLAGYAAGLIIIVSGLAVMQFDALVDVIYRNVKMDWVLGLLVAVVISCGTAQHFWKFRRYLRVWVVYGAYLFLHFAVAVPVLGRTGVDRHSFLLLLALEFALAVSVLKRVTAPLPTTCEPTRR